MKIEIAIKCGKEEDVQGLENYTLAEQVYNIFVGNEDYINNGSCIKH